MRSKVTPPLSSAVLRIGTVFGVTSTVSIAAYFAGGVVNGLQDVFLFSAPLFALSAIVFVVYLSIRSHYALIAAIAVLLLIISAALSTPGSPYANYLASGFGTYDSLVVYFVNPFFLVALLAFIAVTGELILSYRHSEAAKRSIAAYSFTVLAVAYGLYALTVIEILAVGMAKTSWW